MTTPPLTRLPDKILNDLDGTVNTAVWRQPINMWLPPIADVALPEVSDARRLASLTVSTGWACIVPPAVDQHRYLRVAATAALWVQHLQVFPADPDIPAPVECAGCGHTPDPVERANVLDRSIINAIAVEAARAHTLHAPRGGSLLDPAALDWDRRVAALVEEVGEVGRGLTYDSTGQSRTDSDGQLATELVQVASVALSILAASEVVE